jgi:type II secretory pathway component PulC
VKRLIGLAALTFACGATPILEGPAPALLPPPPPAAAEPTAAAHAPLEKLYRDDVVRAVDGGLARFLQKLRVAADLRDGKFRGWLIEGLYPRDFWENVDLTPGDVVTAINGQPIERETQAYDVFVQLKTAPRLVVKCIREGRERTLSFDIIERPQTQPVALAN